MIFQHAALHFAGFFLAAGTTVSRELGYAKDVHPGEFGGVHSNARYFVDDRVDGLALACLQGEMDVSISGDRSMIAFLFLSIVNFMS